MFLLRQVSVCLRLFVSDNFESFWELLLSYFFTAVHPGIVAGWSHRTSTSLIRAESGAENKEVISGRFLIMINICAREVMGAGRGIYAAAAERENKQF